MHASGLTVFAFGVPQTLNEKEIETFPTVNGVFKILADIRLLERATAEKKLLRVIDQAFITCLELPINLLSRKTPPANDANSQPQSNISFQHP